jgi:ferritin-like metal-binding protein YciE
MVKKAGAPELKKALETHRQETEGKWIASNRCLSCSTPHTRHEM